MLRYGLRLFAIVLGALACVPLHYLWRLVRARSPWPRRFLFYVGHVAGLRIRVEGQPLRRHVLFLANHVSWLDILALGGTPGTAFVAKSEIEGWPLVGWLAGLNDTVYIARHDRGSVHGQAHSVREALAGETPVTIFPEGTTDGGVDTLPFRASLLAAVFPPFPGLKVQPVALDYGAAGPEIAWGQEPTKQNFRKIMSRPGTIPLTLRFLAPIDPCEVGDRKALAARARNEVVAALGASEPAAVPV